MGGTGMNRLEEESYTGSKIQKDLTTI